MAKLFYLKNPTSCATDFETSCKPVLLVHNPIIFLKNVVKMPLKTPLKTPKNSIFRKSIFSSVFDEFVQVAIAAEFKSDLDFCTYLFG